MFGLPQGREPRVSVEEDIFLPLCPPGARGGRAWDLLSGVLGLWGPNACES